MTRGQESSDPDCPSWSSGFTDISAAHMGTNVAEALQTLPVLVVIVLIEEAHEVAPPVLC